MIEQHAAYMREYYRRQVDKMVLYLGGRCVKCGSTSELEIDHIDPTTKVKPATQMWNKSWDEIEAELKKCQLLCKTHHMEKSHREGSYLKGVRYGEANGSSKLNLKSVQAIREMYTCGNSLNSIMLHFPNVSKSAIFRVIQNQTWADPNYIYVRN